MFTAFMDDAANIMSFYGDVDVKDSVGYSVEFWMFKPRKSGRQVINPKGLLKQLFKYFVVWITSDKDWECLH